MRKTLLIVLSALVVLIVGGYIFFQINLKNTKKHSPEQTVEYHENGADISIFYCRPSKKGREIFGGILPYGQWWRTGANEPTTITTSKDLVFNGQTLKAGKYHIVTIPEQNEWTIVFNSEIPFWGTQYNPDKDALRVKVPVEALPSVVEMFTITFEDVNGQDAISLAWDQTKVAVPFTVAN
ncbi:MAG: DUF2911 domain-containing protein [Saprospiraceae bacterium]|nr:DUF2911 domain-containing protein [Saprospiraceae bacterium]